MLKTLGTKKSYKREWVFNDFVGSAGPSWKQKSIKKKDVNMRRHLGIDLGWVLVDFGRQIGFENKLKIDPRKRRKSDEKKQDIKRAKKAQQERVIYSGRGKMESRKGVGGRVNLFPRRKEGYRKRSAFQTTQPPGAGGILVRRVGSIFKF